MKKNGPAVKLTVLAPLESRDRIAALILRETSTLGVPDLPGRAPQIPALGRYGSDALGSGSDQSQRVCRGKASRHGVRRLPGPRARARRSTARRLRHGSFRRDGGRVHRTVDMSVIEESDVLTSHDIRRLFVEFFQQRNHLVLPSASLVPSNDPTLLLTSAGMVQMKPYFLGEALPPAPRLASIQKCFRATDIEKVGNVRNLTFFEMLGNFSVGDYFKAGAIEFAWEFLDSASWLRSESTLSVGLPGRSGGSRALAEDRQRAGGANRRARRQLVGGPPVGPDGPDSEVYYDRGKEFGCGKESCAPGCECARFLEVWNLVFMQYYRDSTGVQTPLPRKNITPAWALNG